jgi:hypothetical protein
MLGLPTPADLSLRRFIRDSLFSQSQGSISNTYEDKNISYMLMSRSGGATVKRIVRTIQERCHAQELSIRSSDEDVRSAVSPPTDEMFILARWAVDSYYKVVIARQSGVTAILEAMRVFPWCQGLQECCCLAMANLCFDSDRNLAVMDNAGGFRQIVDTMKNHRTSIAVQSAACDALRNILCMVLQTSSYFDKSKMRGDLIGALLHAQDMRLHPTYLKNVDALLTFLRDGSVNII